MHTRKMNVNDSCNGFKLIRKENLPDVYGGSTLYFLVHQTTGARYIHIENKDTENTFAIVFKTVPQNSTGIAHILEHTVIAGSKKFPVKDPFFSMLTRTLSTFMNAFTSSDSTIYPFSTENRKDYYNLMDVYLDATLFPRIDKLSFLQEGWRHELEKDTETGEEKLIYKGVVYNEMKGAMSSPARVMSRALLESLYPDTPYSHNSGGDPAKIVKLTHEELVSFHRDFGFYHPSNAVFYSYGNFPMLHTISFVGEAIKDFKKIIPKTNIPSQPRWTKPRKAEYAYSLSKTEDPTNKHQACVGWVTANIINTFDIFALDLLGNILLGNQAAPLRKALMDSGLGSTTSDCTGFNVDMKEPSFVCGLKDIKKEDAGKVHKLIFETLRNIVKSGIDKELIDAAIHQLEFYKKEVSGGHTPYGIKIFFRLVEEVIHGCDPKDALGFDTSLKRLEKEIQKGRFFEKLIEKYLLNNPHRVLLTLSPDQEMAEREERRVAAELERSYKNMTEKDLEIIKKRAKQLEEIQNSTPDLSSLPTLEISDIPREIKTVNPPTAIEVDEYEVKAYEQPTSGIFYLSGGIGAGKLSDDLDLMMLLPFFCHILSKINTTKKRYENVVRRIDAYTGGIGFVSENRGHLKNDKCVSFISIHAKCLDRNIEEMLEILKEILTCVDFSDHDRIKKLMFEYKTQLESYVVNSGLNSAISLATRRISPVDYLDEIQNGVFQYQFIKKLIEEDKIIDIAKKLSQIANIIFRKRNIKLTLVGNKESINLAEKGLKKMYKEIPFKGQPRFIFKSSYKTEDWTVNEGWATSSAVSYVASAIKTPKLNHPDGPVLAVIAKLLQNTFIHKEIREKGGAYGGMVIYYPKDGIFTLASYRDPHIVKTIDTYKFAQEFLQTNHFTDEEIKEAILKVCAVLGKVQTPDTAAKADFFRGFSGLTNEDLRAYKEGVLAVTQEDIKRVAAKYLQPGTKVSTAVVSGQSQLKKANEKLGKKALRLFEI